MLWIRDLDAPEKNNVMRTGCRNSIMLMQNIETDSIKDVF